MSDEESGDAGEPSADEGPTLDGQPIFNSEGSDKTRSDGDSDNSKE